MKLSDNSVIIVQFDYYHFLFTLFYFSSIDNSQSNRVNQLREDEIVFLNEVSQDGMYNEVKRNGPK